MPLAYSETEGLQTVIEQFGSEITEVRDWRRKADEEISKFGSMRSETRDRLDRVENDLRTVKQSNIRPPGGAPSSGDAGGYLPLLGHDAKFRDWLRGTRTQKSVFAASYTGFRLEQKAIPLLNAGGTVHIDGIARPPQLALRLVELIPSVPMNQGAAAEYAKETGFTPNAGIAPEGQLKPTTSLDFANVLARIMTIATITKVSVQSLSDTPGIGEWLDSRLRYAVQLKAEGWLLNAAAPDGLLAKAGTLSPDFTPSGTGTTQLDVIGAAIGQLQSAGFTPDGIVLNGVDVNKTRLLKDSEGRYLWSSPPSDRRNVERAYRHQSVNAARFVASGSVRAIVPPVLTASIGRRNRLRERGRLDQKPCLPTRRGAHRFRRSRFSPDSSRERSPQR